MALNWRREFTNYDKKLQLTRLSGSMQVMRESWTDERLDEFGKRMDERFDRVDERFNEVDAKLEQVDKRFEQVDKRFDKIDARLESMQKTMVFGVIAMSSAYIAGFAALVTQL